MRRCRRGGGRRIGRGGRRSVASPWTWVARSRSVRCCVVVVVEVGGRVERAGVNDRDQRSAPRRGSRRRGVRCRGCRCGRALRTEVGASRRCVGAGRRGVAFWVERRLRSRSVRSPRPGTPPSTEVRGAAVHIPALQGSNSAHHDCGAWCAPRFSGSRNGACEGRYSALEWGIRAAPGGRRTCGWGRIRGGLGLQGRLKSQCRAAVRRAAWTAPMWPSVPRGGSCRRVPRALSLR